MTGADQTVGALNGTGGTILSNGPFSQSTVLTIGNGGASGSYGGTVTDRTSGSQLVTLVKVGTGTQILTGSNTYTAGTTVNAGTLLVYNATGSGTGTQQVYLPATGVPSGFGGGTVDGGGGISGQLRTNSTYPITTNISPGSASGDTGILSVGSLDASNTIFNVDIAGTVPGASYDRIAAAGSVNYNGPVRVRFLNGFQTTIQATDTFNILTAGSGPIIKYIANLNDTGRLNAFGTQGSFAVQLVNSGQTLRLTDFQYGSVNFDSWASAHSLSGANAALTADPDGDGLSNLAEYAFGRDPNAADLGALAQTQIVTSGGIKYFAISYARPTGVNTATDITYTPQRTTDILTPGSWASADLVVQSISPGPGALETVTVRSTHPISTLTKEFLRVSVSKP